MALALWSILCMTPALRCKHLSMKTKNCTPLIIGDMHATTSAHDRTSTNKYIADKMYQDFIKDHNLSSLPNHLQVDTNLPVPRPWIFSRPTGKDSVGNTTYSFSRIDDILLPTALANTCKPSYTCDLGYLSDHVPLLAIIPTDILNLRIPKLKKKQAEKVDKQATLVWPISASDQLKFTHALSDPSHGIIQELEETLLVLTPAHMQALVFLMNCRTKVPETLLDCNTWVKSLQKSKLRFKLYKILVTNLIESAHKVALNTCSSTSKRTTDDQQQDEKATQTARSLPQTITIAHDQKRIKEICKAKNYTGSSKFKITTCPPPS